MKQIRSMSFEELIKTRAEIEAAIELHVARERQDLMKMLQQVGVAKASGTKTYAGGSHPLKGKKLPPLYRNPEDKNQTWAGRGNKPRWLSSALKRGKKLENFAI